MKYDCNNNPNNSRCNACTHVLHGSHSAVPWWEIFIGHSVKWLKWQLWCFALGNEIAWNRCSWACFHRLNTIHFLSSGIRFDLSVFDGWRGCASYNRRSLAELAAKMWSVTGKSLWLKTRQGDRYDFGVVLLLIELNACGKRFRINSHIGLFAFVAHMKVSLWTVLAPRIRLIYSVIIDFWHVPFTLSMWMNAIIWRPMFGEFVIPNNYKLLLLSGLGWLAGWLGRRRYTYVWHASAN